MKKGQPLKPMLQKINEDKKHKEDYLVNLESLQCIEREDFHKEFYPFLKFDGSAGKVNKPMTDHALGQLCNKLEIGTSYIRKCLPFPELVNYNLNKWITLQKDRDLMVRCNETKVRAILSNR